MKELFTYGSYKQFLKDYVNEHKRRGLMRDLAEMAGCDRTYLSQVLNGKAQLTADHAINLSTGLRFNEHEEDYFLTLVLLERASEPRAQEKLKRKLKRLAQTNISLSARVKTADAPPTLSDQTQTIYYSSWIYSALHILTSNPDFQTVASISGRLSLSKSTIETALAELVKMNLIMKTGNTYKHRGGNLYLPQSSPLNLINHQNWRSRALIAANSENEIHYTNVFTISREDVASLKNDLLKFIEQQRKKIHSSGTEDLLCFCCDLFEP